MSESDIVTDLLKHRTRLQGFFGDGNQPGERQMLEELDHVIGRLLRVNVYKAPVASNVSLIEIVADDETLLAQILEQLSRGLTASAESRAVGPLFVERTV